MRLPLPRLLTLVTLLASPLFAMAQDDANEAPILPDFLTYRGTLEQDVRGGEDIIAKRFTLTYRIDPASEKLRVLYHIDEDSTGWAWPERIGVLLENDTAAATSPRGAELLHEHDEVLYPLALRRPFFPEVQRLASGAEWTRGDATYAVTGTKKFANRNCWQVTVGGPIGQSETILVERDTGLVVRSVRKVFMGRGDRFDITQELDAANAPAPAAVEAWTTVAESLLKLRGDLDRPDKSTRPDLTPEQLATVSKALPDLLKQSEKTMLAEFVKTIDNDTRGQRSQIESVDRLAKLFTGKKVPAFSLDLLDGSTVEPEAMTGEIVLLHFWDYRGDKLKEPYGQVGYLDFLAQQSKRRRYGLKVYGVAVNPKIAEPDRKSAAVRQTEKLVEFFNLSYPIALDDGTLLTNLGNPKRIGANLPLWVLIGPDGVIEHYHVGTYEIDPNRGLEELSAKVVELVKKKRAAKE